MGRGTRGARAVARTAGVVAAGAVTAARALRGPGRAGRCRPADVTGRAGRWQVVTVDRPPERVLPGGRRPEPLRRLGDGVEVALRPAPGGRGTELAARSAGGGPLTGPAAHLVGDDPGLLIRETLRQVKQLAETGELLRPDRSPLDGPVGPG
ncbi:hypothetical protein C5N14_25100 [Micromonospora sp. MW-13]|uniref:hypothetical protein n=1 Tax=Micromonospora sp. MW-13 TaxID=2094022 RepID=UPI000E43C7D1|nr:hypothetical protein [Micromonospora sp. MW-13]RGC66116.1 hypothetical protein C5N14_25100 [Micromonospora sp. MW-13]